MTNVVGGEIEVEPIEEIDDSAAKKTNPTSMIGAVFITLELAGAGALLIWFAWKPVLGFVLLVAPIVSAFLVVFFALRAIGASKSDERIGFGWAAVGFLVLSYLLYKLNGELAN